MTDDVTSDSIRGRAIGLLALLFLANVAAWLWAVVAFHDFPVLLGSAGLAYSFGSRHAFDADHIAAIDNVTRKHVQEGRRPVAVGLFFALGHSTVVIGLSIGVAFAAGALQGHLEFLKNLGGTVGTLVSSAFLFGIGMANLFVLLSVYRRFRSVQNGGSFALDHIDLAPRGFAGRLCRRLFRLIERSWQMFPLGLLFGLGFDTATEIGLLGISATQVAQGMPIWSILVFPALFTAGMTLIDTADSILMVGLYGWAFVKPIRKLYYNLTITALSVLIAFVVGGVEVLGLLGEHFELTQDSAIWTGIGALNDHFGALGYLIVALFVLVWLGSVWIYRVNRFDRAEVTST